MNALQGLSDTEMIFLALAAFYLWECTCWLRRDAVLLSSGWGECRLPGGRAFRNERGRLLMTNPLPFANSFICQSWPIVLDHHGVIVPSDASGRRETENGPSRLLSFAEIRSIARDGRKVLINGIIAASPPTEPHADFVVGRLRAAWQAGEDDRNRAIEALFDDMMDVSQTNERLRRFRQAVRSLKVACTALACYLFVAGPLLYYAPSFAWHRFLWFYLAGFLAIWLHLVVRYYKARRTLYNEARRTTLGHAIMLVLSPASAMRASEALSRELLAGVEPLAAAAALCRPTELAAFAEQTLRASLFPTTGNCAEELEVQNVRAWFYAQHAARVSQLIRLAGLEPGDLLRQPGRTHDALSYCPRCLSQFVVRDGCCTDCAGVSLKRFAETSVAIDPEAVLTADGDKVS